MNVPEAVREQLRFWHGTLDQMLAECTDDVLERTQGTNNTIAVTWVHAVFAEDGIVQGMLQGKPPLLVSEGWDKKTGVPLANPPRVSPEWIAQIKLDRHAFTEYSKAVYAATDAYLGALSPDDLGKKMQSPFGEQTLGFLVAVLLGTHFPGHAGEIAAMKGMHGLKGLPF
jgi:hypothetical protein